MLTIRVFILFFFFFPDEDYDFHAIRSDLQNHYMGSKVSFLPGIPQQCTDMENLFIDLELLKEDYKPGHNAWEPEIEKLESCSKVVDLKDRKKRRLNRILVRGRPGIGKTCLVSKLAYDWAMDSKYTSQYDLVFVINLSKVKPKAGLFTTVKDQLLKQVPIETIKKYASHKHSILWLFDGFDEVSLDCLSAEIQNVWSCSLCKTHCVVVTSQPHAAARFIDDYGQSITYTHVQLTGFSERSTIEYVCKYFKLPYLYKWLTSPLIPTNLGHYLISFCPSYRVHHVLKFIKQLRYSEKIQELAQLPLFLTMMCAILPDHKQIPESVTSLYRYLVEYLHKQRDGKGSEKNRHDLLLYVGKMALGGLFEGKYDFETNSADESFLLNAIELGIVIKENKIVKQNNLFISKPYVYFLHTSFQEMSAAIFWASLAKQKPEQFNKFLQKINETNIDQMEYLMRFCCAEDVSAAELIISHVVSYMGEILRKSSNICLFSVGDLSRKSGRVMNPWKLPLLLLFEAESHPEAESVHCLLKPIVSKLEMYMKMGNLDEDVKMVLEHLISKYNTTACKTWLSFVNEAVCTFYSEEDLGGIFCDLLHYLSNVKVLNLNGHSHLSFFGFELCNLSALVGKLKSHTAVHTSLTDLTVSRCSINIVVFLELLVTLPNICNIKLSAVKVLGKFLPEQTQCTNTDRSISLCLDGEEDSSSDFDLLFGAFTLYPSIMASVKEFHCLRLQLQKSILCDYFAHLSSIPERTSFQQVEVGDTLTAPEHMVKYEFGKLTISGKGAPGCFDCKTWVECFSSCQIAADSLTVFRCIDCFVDATTLQGIFRKCTAIESLRLDIYKPKSARWRDVDLHVDNEKMIVSVPDDITKWLRCLNTWCNARYTLKKLSCNFGSVNTNELLHFCSQQQSPLEVDLRYITLTQATRAGISDAFPVTHQNLVFDLHQCKMDCKSLVNITTKSPKELMLSEIYLINIAPASSYDNLMSHTEQLGLSGHDASSVDLLGTEKTGGLFTETSLKDAYNDLVQYKSITFPDYSPGLDILAHIHMPSLELLLVQCCKLSAQSLGKFLCQSPHVQECSLLNVTMTGTITTQQKIPTSLKVIYMVNCNIEVDSLVSLVSQHTWDTLYLYQTTISPATDWFKTVFDEHNGIDAEYVWIYGENSPIPMISSAALGDMPTGTSKLYKDDDQKVVDVANTVFYKNYYVKNYEGFEAIHCRFYEERIFLLAVDFPDLLHLLDLSFQYMLTF